MDGDFSSELNAWLDEAGRARVSAAAEDRYEVDRTLKDTPAETTQVVYRRSAGDVPLGPFVRKILHGAGGTDGGQDDGAVGTDDGRGAAYRHIFSAQTRGVRLAHQPILYDLAARGGSLEVIMEYVHGQSLDALVAREGAGIDLARRIAPDLCEAADELHQRLDVPIIHRDIKPANVMIADDGRLVLIDLGIARAWREGASRDTVRYGTPGYAPPEQYGYGQTDVRSDVYALGMTIAFCLLGAEPGPVRDAAFEDVRVPVPLRPVLVRATHFDPAMRQPSARTLLDEVLDALDGPQASGRASAPQAPAPDRFVGLGRFWNALVTVVWLFLCAACVVVIVEPSPETSVADYPTWFRACMYILMGIVPFTCIAYLLCDKRRLRQHPPFAGRTWRQDLGFCLILVGGLFLALLALYMAFVI